MNLDQYYPVGLLLYESVFQGQRAKKVVSDSAGLVDFAIGLVNSVFKIKILLVKTFLGLVEMTSGLVNASFSLPEWQAVKMIFFAPCKVNMFH